VLLKEFLSTTDAFGDLERHLDKEGARKPLWRDALENAIDLLANADEKVGVPTLQLEAVLDVRDEADTSHLLRWIEETFPTRQIGGRLLLVSKLFRAWWLRQGQGAMA